MPDTPTSTARAVTRGKRLSVGIARSWLIRYHLFCIGLLCAWFTIIVYYPGFMSPDSGEQLRQARFGVTSNAFPPLMAYVWRVTDKILPGPAGMLILHNMLFWSAIATIAWFATANAVLRAAFVLSALSPPLLCNLGIVWKDTEMIVALTVAVALICAADHTRQLRWLACAVIAIFFACGFRHNALAAALPLMVIMLGVAVRIVPAAFPEAHQWLRERELLRSAYALALGATMVVLLAGVQLVYSWGVRDYRLYAGALIHDLAGISVAQGVDYLPEFTKRRAGVTLDDLKRMYSPLHANSLYLPESRQILGVPDALPDKTLDYLGTEQEIRDLRERWFVTVVDNPGSYLKNKLVLMHTLLVLTPYQPWYPYITGIDPNPLGLVYHRSKLNAAVMFVVQYSAFSTHLFSAWIYYAIVIGCGLVSFLWNFRHAWLVRALCVSTMLYLLSIFFFGMSGDFRYNLWALVCCHMCVFLLASGHGRDTAA